ncbi:flagellar basal-body MS-ring/collar protein FliF [Neobacillus sp. LXY-4]|uniref:flagellar basal-body MS-ring/collar protein FliF n=1 Tax=Neobacillus sp. LXY-4 TaxID=3379826 RepID=UPI003EE39828
MNKFVDFKEKITQFWKNVSKKNKAIYIGSFLGLIVILSVAIFFVSKPNLVPLYANNLSQKEIGEIKGVLDKQGFTEYEIASNGTQILVPNENVPDLIVNLASEGLPKNGSISFSEQTKDLKFGVTERELDVMEREVIQAQLANLISKISGVKSAEVMITLPKESVFIRPETEDKSSASIIVNLEPGEELDTGQVKALYHLAAKSIPNLPEENIIITDQNGQLLALPKTDDSTFEELDGYEKQRQIKQKVEADIQRSIQQMLGTMLGQDKVLVQTFAKLNFDKVKTNQSLVEPVDPEANEGIAVSVEKVTKSYSGQGAVPGGADSPAEDIEYPAASESENNEYEEVQNRVNYEFNRITKEIIESPYTIEDLTINVGVEPPEPDDPQSLTLETQNNIKSIISNVVRTAIDNNGNSLEDDEINNRITIFPREFSGKTASAAASSSAEEKASYLSYILWGVLALILIAAGVFLWKYLSRKSKLSAKPTSEYLEVKNINELEKALQETKPVDKEIHHLAEENIDEFVSLLRYWIKEEKEG